MSNKKRTKRKRKHKQGNRRKAKSNYYSISDLIGDDTRQKLNELKGRL